MCVCVRALLCKGQLNFSFLILICLFNFIQPRFYAKRRDTQFEYQQFLQPKKFVFHRSRCMQQVSSLQQLCCHLCADTHRRICRVPRVVMLATGTVELDSCSSWYNTVQSDMASKLFLNIAWKTTILNPRQNMEIF